MRRSVWRRLGAALLLAVLLGAPLVSSQARAASAGEKIRVGFPIQQGFTMVDENGNLSGYTYEYLQEIAQYTGWEYEFVVLDGEINDSLTRATDMLVNGEVDLLGAMNYSPALAEYFSYPSESCGTVYAILAVLDENAAITENNYAMKKGLRIAVAERAVERNQQLERFCEASHVDAEYISCANDVEQLEKLRSGEADAVLWVDLALEDGMRQIARFAPTPFYFAATKGNDELVGKLNRAIAEINEADPYFEVALHERYFSGKHSGMRLSAEEAAYIRGVDALRVGVMLEKTPMQDIDPETGEFTGVAREIFDYIAERTGLRFQFVAAKNSDELASLLAEGKLDLAASIPYDYQVAELYSVALGRPYIEAQVTMVLSQGLDADGLEGRTLALAKGFAYHGGPEGEILWCDTLPECIEAVESGRADYALGNSYIVQHYAERGGYRGITTVPYPGMTQKLCIGVSKPVDMVLLTILNKAVLNLSQSELQSMIYHNAVPERQITLAGFLRDNPLTVILAVVALAAAVIAGVLIYLRVKIRFTRRLALENERYRQLSELSNEHIYEYDVEKDCLTLTEKSAEALGAQRVQEDYLFKLRQDQSPRSRQQQELFREMQEKKEATADLRCTLPDGSQRWFRITGKLICDQDGKPKMSIGKLTDIQDEREKLNRLEDRARRDSLTKLYNAAAVRTLVSGRLEREENRGALFIIDVDNFKDFNDRYGHFVGDQVLTAQARLLERLFRRDDVVGRLGGDEFIVFMDAVASREAVEAKCRQIVAQAAEVSGLPPGLKVTMSVGCAMVERGEGYDRLYQRADKGLYAVKGRGRNGFEIVSDGPAAGGAESSEI